MTPKRSKPLASLVASRYLGTTCAAQTVTSSFSADRRHVLCRKYALLSRAHAITQAEGGAMRTSNFDRQVRYRYLIPSPICHRACQNGVSVTYFCLFSESVRVSEKKGNATILAVTRSFLPKKSFFGVTASPALTILAGHLEHCSNTPQVVAPWGSRLSSAKYPTTVALQTNELKLPGALSWRLLFASLASLELALEAHVWDKNPKRRVGHIAPASLCQLPALFPKKNVGQDVAVPQSGVTRIWDFAVIGSLEEEGAA
ncbi:hypothetical protein BJY52DRAFT_1226428 [Lactarius psammicola]|nr:hypothetical protein BJY52DRAFT_1226428 [Lactarius psammicola]